MIKHIFCMILLVLACSIYGKSTPDWVIKEPIDTLYFSSMVTTDKAKSDYKERAHELALKNISMQISVQVSAQLSLREVEKSGLSKSDFESQINTSTHAILSNVELMDVYETKKQYWAFYRLNKQVYYHERLIKKDQAVEQAIQMVEQYDNNNDDMTSGIIILLNAMDAIEDFVDMDLTTIRNGNKFNLYNEIYFRIQQLPLLLNPQFVNSDLSLIAKQKLDKSLILGISRNYGKQIVPCKHFPLVFYFSKGSGNIPDSGFSDDAGKYLFIISRINSFDANQTIMATIDKSYFLKQIKSQLVYKMFSNLEFKKAILNLTVSKPKIFIAYTFDGSMKDKYFTRINDKCILWSLEVTKDKNIAQYMFEVQAISRNGDFIPALRQYSGYVDLKISLVDLNSSDVLYSNSLANIKGTSTTSGLSVEKAELAAIDMICNDVLSNVLQEFILN